MGFSSPWGTRARFAPLLIDEDGVLRTQAAVYWRTVQEAPLDPEVRDILSQVLEFWFFERFRGLTAQEVWAMLNLVTPIQETKAYQSIFAEGKVEGKVEGKAEGKVEGKVESLKRLLRRRFGPVPAWAEQRIDAAEVEQLDAWLDGIFDAANLEDLIGDDPGCGPCQDVALQDHVAVPRRLRKPKGLVTPAARCHACPSRAASRDGRSDEQDRAERHHPVCSLFGRDPIEKGDA